MGYVERHLLAGERVVYKTRLHWALFLKPALVVLRWPNESHGGGDGTPADTADSPPEKRLKESEGKESSSEVITDPGRGPGGVGARLASSAASAAIREQLAELAMSKRMSG